MKPHVVFVGAGPVGLLSAIQVKLSDPGLDILLLERACNYTQKHALLVDKTAFQNLHSDPHFQTFLDRLPASLKKNELEWLLLNYARSLGIQIQETGVSDCHALLHLYPDAEIFVGADGADSILHSQIFRNEYQINKTLNYVLEIRYEVYGQSRYLDEMTELGSVSTLSGIVVSEFVGKEFEGKSSVSIRFFVDEAMYEKLKEATFESPWRLADVEKVEGISNLVETIREWLTCREDELREIRVGNEVSITLSNLPVYSSRNFAIYFRDRVWMLVGDSALSVSYYQGLTKGVLCSAELAKSICAFIHRDLVPNPAYYDDTSTLFAMDGDPVEYYNGYVQDIVNRDPLLDDLKKSQPSPLICSFGFFRPVFERAEPLPIGMTKTCRSASFPSLKVLDTYDNFFSPICELSHIDHSEMVEGTSSVSFSF